MLARALTDDIRPDYTMDQPYARYTGTDHAVWRQLFERQGALLKGRACNEFLSGLAGLGVEREGIPQFDRLTEALMNATGWQIVAVPGGSASPSRWITCRSPTSSTTSTAMCLC